MNLNTEDSVLINTYSKNPFDSDISIRTQYKNSYDTYHKKTLHFPIVKREDFNKVMNTCFDNNLEMIVARPIDPKDCLFAGCIMLYNGEYIIEIANGPGTVRRVTHQGIINEHYTANMFLPRTSNLKINQALVEIYKLNKRMTLSDYHIFEFSYYNKPVGWKKENIIFWEFNDLSKRLKK